MLYVNQNIFFEEVSPNGYVQQVDPVNYYERECLVEYEFDRKS